MILNLYNFLELSRAQVFFTTKDIGSKEKERY